MHIYFSYIIHNIYAKIYGSYRFLFMPAFTWVLHVGNFSPSKWPPPRSRKSMVFISPRGLGFFHGISTNRGLDESSVRDDLERPVPKPGWERSPQKGSEFSKGIRTPKWPFRLRIYNKLPRIIRFPHGVVMIWGTWLIWKYQKHDGFKPKNVCHFQIWRIVLGIQSLVFGGPQFFGGDYCISHYWDVGGT